MFFRRTSVTEPQYMLNLTFLPSGNVEKTLVLALIHFFYDFLKIICLVKCTQCPDATARVTFFYLNKMMNIQFGVIWSFLNGSTSFLDRLIYEGLYNLTINTNLEF